MFTPAPTRGLLDVQRQRLERDGRMLRRPLTACRTFHPILSSPSAGTNTPPPSTKHVHLLASDVTAYRPRTPVIAGWGGLSSASSERCNLTLCRSARGIIERQKYECREWSLIGVSAILRSSLLYTARNETQCTRCCIGYLVYAKATSTIISLSPAAGRYGIIFNVFVTRKKDAHQPS